QAHLLAIGQLEVVAVGIGDERPVADGWTGVERSPYGAALLARERGPTLDFLVAFTADAEVREAGEHAARAFLLDEHDHERTGAVAHPYHLLTGLVVATAM